MTRFYTATFRCQTVTPMFLGGADPRAAPELRAPSLRGAMRYWFRALAGLSDVQSLQHEEAKVFGSQEGASPLRVRTGWSRDPVPQGWSPGNWPPGSRSAGPRDVNGLVYLGFSFRGETGRDPRQAIDAGWHFEVTLAAPTSAILAQGVAAFWTLAHFGGLGSRTRRGFGSIGLGEVSGDVDATLAASAGALRTPAELASHVSNGLRVARGLVPTGQGEWSTEYTTLGAATARAVVLGQTWPTWHEALRELGEALARHRQELAPRLDDLEAWGAGGHSGPQHPRAAFGLPIVYYRPSTRESLTLQATPLTRRASPLWIRPLRIEGGRYAILLWLSRSRFWPTGAQLDLMRRNQRVRTLPGEVPGDAVEAFLSICSARWGAHEVRLP